MDNPKFSGGNELNVNDFFKGGIREKKSEKRHLHIKGGLVVLMLISLLALGVTGYRASQLRLMAYEVYLGKDKIGTVRDQEEILPIIENIKKELSNTYNMDISLTSQVSFEETKARDSLITSTNELNREIKSKMDFLVYGYSLKVDGKSLGALKTKEEMEGILEKIKEPYLDLIGEDDHLREVLILEDMEIVREEIPLSDLGKEEDIYNYLITSAEEIKTHVVEVGESFWTIGLMYGLGMEDLEEANPDKNPNRLQIGDEIKLVVPRPILTVATISEVEYIDTIKYETETELNDKMYKNESKTKVAGVQGSAKILAKETKHNGILVDKEIVEEVILEEPVTEIIVKGTKEVPKTVATGVFLMPTRGRISSRYGSRWGRMHNGLDIAASTGTAINAADGGKVVHAGYRGAFGNLVEIDHGNGYKTRYAHASKIHVKVGDKVYKGQHIANVGNTGRSTGPHLHFEVLKNGKNVNPSNFVK